MAKVSNGYEEGVFRTIDHDEFQLNARKLEIHAHEPDTSNLVLDILRDAIELKKLNNSLMKGSLIDDLIVDCYAFVYQGYIATLPEKESTESTMIPLDQPQHGNRERMKLGSILTSQADGNTESRPDSQSTQSTNLTSPGMLVPLSKQTRPKTVTRREVQRKAEGLIVRPPPIKTPTLLKNTTFSRPFIAVEIPRSSQHVRSSSVTDAQPAAVGLGLGPVEGSRIVDIMRQDGEDVAPSVDSSRPGSVHDSADDESELSELEEVDHALEDVEVRAEAEKHHLKPGILFPGLVRGEVTTNDDSSVVISDSESARMDVDDRSEKGDCTQEQVNDAREDSVNE